MARPLKTSDDQILDALVTSPEVTAAELAVALGIGQSTAAKRLAALEVAGSTRRHPGGRVDGTRVADRWSAATLPTPAWAQELGREAKRPSPGTGKAAPMPATAVAGAAGRLGRGVLRTLVLDYLYARPTESLGPSAARQGPRAVTRCCFQLARHPGGPGRGRTRGGQTPPIPGHRLATGRYPAVTPGTPGQ